MLAYQVHSHINDVSSRNLNLEIYIKPESFSLLVTTKEILLLAAQISAELFEAKSGDILAMSVCSAGLEYKVITF